MVEGILISSVRVTCLMKCLTQTSWVGNSLLAGCVRRVDFDGAGKVLGEECPDMDYNGCRVCPNGHCKLALSLLNEMKRAGVGGLHCELVLNWDTSQWENGLIGRLKEHGEGDIRKHGYL